jgi:hypothetical protein
LAWFLFRISLREAWTKREKSNENRPLTIVRRGYKIPGETEIRLFKLGNGVDRVRFISLGSLFAHARQGVKKREWVVLSENAPLKVVKHQIRTGDISSPTQIETVAGNAFPCMRSAANEKSSLEAERVKARGPSDRTCSI